MQLGRFDRAEFQARLDALHEHFDLSEFYDRDEELAPYSQPFQMTGLFEIIPGNDTSPLRLHAGGAGKQDMGR